MLSLQLNQLQVTEQLDKDLYSAVVTYNFVTSSWTLYFSTQVPGDADVWISKQRGGLRTFKTADAALSVAAACGFFNIRVYISDLNIDKGV